MATQDPVAVHCLNHDLKCIKSVIKINLKLALTKVEVTFVEIFSAIFWNSSKRTIVHRLIVTVILKSYSRVLDKILFSI
jgi:hypothetical protein